VRPQVESLPTTKPVLVWGCADQTGKHSRPESSAMDDDRDLAVPPPPRTCTVLAHNKMVLHALKYTTSAVLGTSAI